MNNNYILFFFFSRRAYQENKYISYWEYKFVNLLEFRNPDHNYNMILAWVLLYVLSLFLRFIFWFDFINWLHDFFMELYNINYIIIISFLLYIFIYKIIIYYFIAFLVKNN